VLIDNVEKASGHMEDDWDFLQPATIKDPAAVKPEDWDERAMIVDPVSSQLERARRVHGARCRSLRARLCPTRRRT
jgi:hypothetical protein